MSHHKVAILLSTYNGEKYLEQLIESICNQSFTNWNLYIRDDGSKDNTIKIINKYLEKDKRIKFINQKKVRNLGVVRSFFELFQEVDADFYMFSDQDDFWLPNKVEKTINRMLSLEYNQEPICVYTNLRVVDQNLNGNELLLNRGWQKFTELLFTNNVYGCTMMVNHKVKELVKFDKIDYDNIFMHDWWLTLLAAAFGTVSFINEPTILYRQHEDNQVGAASKSFRSLVKRVLNNNEDRLKMKRSVRFATELLKNYEKTNFSEKDFQYVRNYGQLKEKSSLIHNIKIAFATPPKSIHKLKEIFYFYILIVYYKDYR